jgi:hypothetical protein
VFCCDFEECPVDVVLEFEVGSMVEPLSSRLGEF